MRPMPMRRTLARLVLPAAAVLLVAGCGSEAPSSDKASAESTEGAAAMIGRCPTDAPGVKSAPTIATVDLDGDGQGDAVRLTRSGGRCADVLFAKLGNRYVGTQLQGGEPPVSAAYGVQVPGHQGALLVTREEHPRGGFQLRLYAAGKDAELTELEVDGHSVLPFVALDVQEHPLSIDCSDGGVVVTEAVAHEPHGVVFAWDIKRTSYAVDGSEVTKGATREIADNVLPGQLAAKYPELVKYSAFKGCKTGG
jgi:hypothetical protein